MCDVRSHFSPISIHLFQSSHVIVTIQKLITALLRFDGFQTRVFQHDDHALLRILFLRLLEAILLGLLDRLVRHGRSRRE